MARRPSVNELERLEWAKRIRAIRGADTQAVFAERTGFSLRQVKRWEQGAMPQGLSAQELADATRLPVRLFLPPPEPTLTEIGQKLDLLISLLQSKNGRQR